MKLNLHVPFKAWNGEEIKGRTDKIPAEKKQAYRFIYHLGFFFLAFSFFYLFPVPRPSSDAEMVAKQKLASYELYCKISKAKGVVELTVCFHMPTFFLSVLQSVHIPPD